MIGADDDEEGERRGRFDREATPEVVLPQR
jgi:hypothetical protein